MDKRQAYEALVKQRKACRICEIPYGLKNQSAVNQEYDQDMVIGAWSNWQDSLDAKILLVGQDWGDINTFIKYRGKSGLDLDTTDINLCDLFKSIGVQVSHPMDNKKNPLLFFTNTVLCLKDGGLAAKIPSKCYNACAERYLKGLIEIIRPSIIITLGNNAYKSVARLYGKKPQPFTSLVNSIKLDPKPLKMSGYGGLPNIALLPAPHCGQYSTNTFMSLNDQKTVWSSLKGIL